ncbi:hypothetical protein TB2_030008 [Malus domestica]
MRPDGRYEIVHRVRRFDSDGCVRQYRYEEDCFASHNTQNYDESDHRAAESPGERDWAWVAFLVGCLEKSPACRSSHTYWSDSSRVLMSVLSRTLRSTCWAWALDAIARMQTKQNDAAAVDLDDTAEAMAIRINLVAIVASLSFDNICSSNH